MIRYSKEHEWIRVEGEIGTIGITQYAKGEACAVVESVKAASDIYAPVSGEVVEANAGLADSPGDVNAEPMGKGWFFKIKLSDKGELSDLMDEAAYDDFVKSLS
jgi:glycine cleavage system H protein